MSWGVFGVFSCLVAYTDGALGVDRCRDSEAGIWCGKKLGVQGWVVGAGCMLVVRWTGGFGVLFGLLAGI